MWFMQKQFNYKGKIQWFLSAIRARLKLLLCTELVEFEINYFRLPRVPPSVCTTLLSLIFTTSIFTYVTVNKSDDQSKQMRLFLTDEADVLVSGIPEED